MDNRGLKTEGLRPCEVQGTISFPGLDLSSGILLSCDVVVVAAAGAAGAHRGI